MMSMDVSLEKAIKENKPQQRDGIERMKSFFSQILDDTLDEEERKYNPELIRVRNNILIILLLFSAYGVFYLIGDFVNILLTAYIAGIAYQQIRERFTRIVMSKESYQGHTSSLPYRFIAASLLLMVCFFLPFLHLFLKSPHFYKSPPTFNDFVSAIQKCHNSVVIGCQILILVYIFYLILGTHLKKIGEKLRPTNVPMVKTFFALVITLATIGTIILIPIIMFRQVNLIAKMTEEKIERNLGCQIMSFNKDNSSLPFCSDKISTENQFIKNLVGEFRNQNETIQKCQFFLRNTQMDYIGKQIFDYEEIACTWYSVIEKGLDKSGYGSGLSDMVYTGTSVFRSIFGNLTSILGLLSSFFFSLTTFITMFLLTIQFKSHSKAVKQIFSENKQQLISSVTSLIQATLFIVIEHFFFSIILLQFFSYTSTNLLLALLLSSMAFFPFFRPWFGILLVGLLRILLFSEYYISLSFIMIYYLVSQKIYSIHYRKMQIHEIITNMSVLFGIYRFGITGIFYGPLIIMMYKFVEKELLLKQMNSRKK